MNFKKNLLILLIITVLTGLVSKVYFHQGFPYTHDGENHLARFANYKVALKEGQFPPRLAPNLMNHYGYPVFNYNYPLANILSLPFSFIKLNYQLTFKILATASLFFGLLGIWRWLHTLTITDNKLLFLALSNYATAPFIVSLFYHRGNIGEMLAGSMLPWLFAELSISANLRKSASPQRFFKVLTICLWTAFLLSHNITVMFGTGILLLYFFAQKPRIIDLKSKLVPFVLGIAASIWFWLPAVAEKSFVVLDGASLSSGFVDHFVSSNQLILNPNTFGFSLVGTIDTLSLGAGITSIFIVLVSILFFLKSSFAFKIKQVVLEHRVLFILTALSFLCLVFQLEISAPVWRIIPLASYIQFPWRLTLFFTISSSVVLGLLLSVVKSRVIWIITSLLVAIQVLVLFNTKAVDYFSKNILDYDLFAQSTSTANENLPNEFTYLLFAGEWQPRPSILQENTETQVNVHSWTGSSRTYSVSTNEAITVVEPSMRFPGWETHITTTNGENENKAKATYNNNHEIGGRIAYQLEPGKHEIKTVFTQNTPARLIGNAISATSIFGITVWFLLTILHTFKTFKKNEN